MQFLKRNILTLCCLTLLVAMGLCGDAWADGASLMSTAQTKTRNVFDNVKTITFILGGFGLVGIAFQAIIGKVKWTWFAGLVFWLLPVQSLNMQPVLPMPAWQRLSVIFNQRLAA